MQISAAPSPSPNTASFEGLLASLTAPPPRPVPPAWNDDALADDVTTLSYERALHSYNRYVYAPPADKTLGIPSIPPAVDESAPAQASKPAPRASASAQPQPARPVFNRDLKCASITIRLSEAECAQLRMRAAEAGLTVSAYLRSCTFEAESLRALVKDTMAQLRCATAAAKPGLATQPRRRRARSLFKWLKVLLTPWPAPPHTVKA